MEFTKEQQYAFQQFINKHNIFVTGPGGSGKSIFIKQIVKYLKHHKKKYQVCALTGCAAVLLNCGAKTIHSWGGLGLAKGNIEDLANKIAIHSNKKKNWKYTDVLIIDEVSMMSEKIFNLLDLIAKKVRKNQKPFGGIQLVFCGDFFQLPPVGSELEPETCNFCFESNLFEQTFNISNQIEFTKIFRQTDPIYTKILNQIRIGRISRKTVDILNLHLSKKIPDNALIKPTILFPKKKQVDRINQQSMENLDSESKNFSVEKFISPVKELKLLDQQKMNLVSEEQIKYEHDYILNNINCESCLELKKGAQVMCTVNLDFETSANPICNGSQGIVDDFDNEGFPIVKFYNGIVKTISPYKWASENYPGIGIKQLPLILSWAITIHKSQGISLELAQIDIGSDIFECGQTYVALSRLISLEGLYLNSFNPHRIKVNSKVSEFYLQMKHQQSKNKLDAKSCKQINQIINLGNQNSQIEPDWDITEDFWLYDHKDLSIVEISEFLQRSKENVKERLKIILKSDSEFLKYLSNLNQETLPEIEVNGL